MRKTSLNLAMLATLAAFTGVVHADMNVVQSNISSSATAAGVTFSFSGLSLDGFQFVQVVGPLASYGFATGSLTGVSVNATLDASVGYTYGDDLTIYVNPGALATGGLLQVGGFSDLSASERHLWANGGSSSPGTTVIDTVVLTTPISFAGGAADPIVWLGNGYGAAGVNGTWSGSITLNFASAVPEPSSVALLALGGLGMIGWVGRRRRSHAA